MHNIQFNPVVLLLNPFFRLKDLYTMEIIRLETCFIHAKPVFQVRTSIYYAD